MLLIVWWNILRIFKFEFGSSLIEGSISLRISPGFPLRFFQIDDVADGCSLWVSERQTFLEAMIFKVLLCLRRFFLSCLIAF
jgi:hypothetical protein